VNVELVKDAGADQLSSTRNRISRQNSQTYDVIFDSVGKCSFGLQESLTAPALYRRRRRDA